jgi:hypothetical protein
MEREIGMSTESLLALVRAEVKNTIVSYFSPVRVVIEEIARAVAAETPTRDRAIASASGNKPTGC